MCLCSVQLPIIIPLDYATIAIQYIGDVLKHVETINKIILFPDEQPKE